MVKISASILSADFACLESEVKKVKGAEWLHIDVMDGRFVPNITIGPLVVKALRKITKQFLDVHLMVENPERHIEAFAKAGADLITVHSEACPNLRGAVDLIKKNGCKAGVSIKPGTDLRAIEGVLDRIDVALVMTVEPGFGGQEFMPHTLSKITRLRDIAASKNAHFEIEADGGINKDNCADVAKAGAGVLVAGSAIFRSDDPAAMLGAIRRNADKRTGKKKN
jgi:ribulose-phosphate 3-epimerase